MPKVFTVNLPLMDGYAALGLPGAAAEPVFHPVAHAAAPGCFVGRVLALDLGAKVLLLGLSLLLHEVGIGADEVLIRMVGDPGCAWNVACPRRGAHPGRLDWDDWKSASAADRAGQGGGGAS